MTIDQENHVDGIMDDFIDDAKPKYDRGTREHPGNLWEVPLPKIMEMLNEEVVDLVVYFYTIRPIVEKLYEENKQLKQHVNDLKNSTIEE